MRVRGIMSASLRKAPSRFIWILLLKKATQNNVSFVKYPEHAACVVHVPSQAAITEAQGGSSAALYKVFCSRDLLERR